MRPCAKWKATDQSKILDLWSQNSLLQLVMSQKKFQKSLHPRAQPWHLHFPAITVLAAANFLYLQYCTQDFYVCRYKMLFLGLIHSGENKFAGWVYTLLYLSACKIMPGSGQFIIKILHEHKNKNKHAAAILDLPWILPRPFKHLSALKISWDYP